MYCLKCGKEIKDDSAFCPFCGEPVAQSTSERDTQRSQQPGYNVGQDNNSDYNPDNDETTYQEVPMGWYNFLIYVGLFLYAYILISYLMISRNSPLWSYAGSLWLQALFCIFSIVMGFRAIMIRQDLKYFRINAGKSYIRDITIWGVACVLYFTIGTVMLYGFSSLFLGVFLFSAVPTGVYIYCNMKYFQNREYLFQN